MGEPLILIDGDDEDQVAWAKSRPGKIVLVNGNPIELSNLLGGTYSSINWLFF
ncbi:putative conjugative transfer protein [Orientia tsutsugamushi str. Gilliam]|uniref:Putative conjugative transfer protein n=1 Tax=Orientia tsutsugamushi str. Gilliam TaxID=1359184 RepID=A0A0F3MA36_ORITS|nr:hypothetical protein [Orientia tsutsugamushi]KJV52347.1 putative conjugative transfer protein [Orientia tsutsugamushi str. Gilliam]